VLAAIELGLSNGRLEALNSKVAPGLFARNATVTITPSAPNATSLTHAP
jgi:hypothetical protein